MLRVVIDTNVIVSGILSRKGAPAEVLNAWRERRFLLLSSSAIVAEVRTVLQYPRIYKNIISAMMILNRRLHSWNMMPCW